MRGHIKQTAIEAQNKGARYRVSRSFSSRLSYGKKHPPNDVAEEYKALHNRIRGEKCGQSGLWLISSDVTGERDGRISLGPTSIINSEGEVVQQLPLHQSGLLIYDMSIASFM